MQRPQRVLLQLRSYAVAVTEMYKPGFRVTVSCFCVLVSFFLLLSFFFVIFHGSKLGVL